MNTIKFVEMCLKKKKQKQKTQGNAELQDEIDITLMEVSIKIA